MASFHHNTSLRQTMTWAKRPQFLGFIILLLAHQKPNTWPKRISKWRAAHSKRDRENFSESTGTVSLLCSKATLGNSSRWLQILCLRKRPTLFRTKVFIVSRGTGDKLAPISKGLASDRCLELHSYAEQPHKLHRHKAISLRTARRARCPAGARKGSQMQER